jgi:exosortase/archaeosortase family protein
VTPRATGSVPAAVSPRRIAAVVVRAVVGTGLVVLGVLALMSVAAFQMREAWFGAWALEHVFGRPSRTLTTGPTYLYQEVPGDDTSWAGLVVTSECSAAFFVGGVLVVGGLLVIVWHRSPAVRLLVATAATIALLLLVNTARLALLAEAAARWGTVGFGWAHTVAGSILMIATLCLSVIVFVRVGLLRRPQPNQRA